MKILAVHSSRFGHTASIVYRIAERLRAAGHEVEVRPINAMRGIDPGVDSVLVGASVRYGFFAPVVWRFAKRHVTRLNAIPTAFVGINLAAVKPEKDTPETNPYARRFLTKTPWTPSLIGLFGGELDFRLYNKVDTAMLKPILNSSGKPWGPNIHLVYTDWDAVDAFADDYAALLASASTEHSGETLSTSA